MDSTVDQSKCKKCKLCIEVCPCNIPGINKNNEVYFIPGREAICQHCGQCMAVCSTEAITVDGLSYEKDFEKLPENGMDYKSFVGFLANRRSIRNFKNKPVPDEVINQMLDTVAYAPYGAAPDKMNITVINNRKKIESALPYMASFLDNIVKWIDNPIASYMIKRRTRPETFNTIKNHLYPISALGNYRLEYGDRITRNAPALIIFHARKDAEEHTSNSLIYATYAMLAVHSLGLGAAMNGLVPAAINKVKEVREIFQIPEENEVIIALIVGYPKYKYQRTIRRPKQKINWIN